MSPIHAKDKFETYEKSKEIESKKWAKKKKKRRRKGKDGYFGSSDILLSLTKSTQMTTVLTGTY